MTENDVKEYFSRYGYVLDVYLPKNKDNKSEHRGFGFITFETEAAIQVSTQVSFVINVITIFTNRFNLVFDSLLTFISLFA